MRLILTLLATATLLALLIRDAPVAVSLARPQLSALVPQLSPTPLPQLENSLAYPRLGISAPLTDGPNTSPLVASDWQQLKEALRKGVMLSYSEDSFADAPFAYAVGHSSDTYPHAFSSIFAALGQAEPGDTFTLRVDEYEHSYAVTRTLILDPNDTRAFEALRQTDRPTVALVTCWPILTTSKRLVVLGERM